MTHAKTLVGRLATYTVEGTIGRGAMGTVYRARTSSGDVCAIKRVLATTPQFARAAHDEARILSLVRHPNVVAFRELIATDVDLFIVMEMAEGESLRTLIRQSANRKRGPSVDAAVMVAVDALRGLHAAHEARDESGLPLEVVHRDVSPENLVVAPSGVTRLVDFGLAKAHGREQSTTSGKVRGKTRYLAPEQIHGRASRAADMFVVGVVLWELLAGRRLIEGRTPTEILTTVLSLRAPPPSSASPLSIPRELDAVVLRSLSVDPDRRFESAEAMADALAQAAPHASHRAVADWVYCVVRDTLRE